MEGEKLKGRVRGLYLFRERGQPGEPVEEARFLKDTGMEGDCHAKGGGTQITLLAGEVRDWMRVQPESGLCFGRYKANIETAGLATEILSPGMVLTAGTAVFQVSETEKKCFPECGLFQKGKECKLSQGGVFLKVLQTGRVSNNDKIAIGGV